MSAKGLPRAPREATAGCFGRAMRRIDNAPLFPLWEDHGRARAQRFPEAKAHGSHLSTGMTPAGSRPRYGSGKASCCGCGQASPCGAAAVQGCARRVWGLELGSHLSLTLLPTERKEVPRRRRVCGCTCLSGTLLRIGTKVRCNALTLCGRRHRIPHSVAISSGCSSGTSPARRSQKSGACTPLAPTRA